MWSFFLTRTNKETSIATEKMPSIKHVPNDIILWADPENISCEGPDKKLAKGQGGKLIKVKLEINL